MSLAQARDRRYEARKLLASGIDPGALKQAQKAADVLLNENSFEVVAREWFVRHSPNWKENHSSKIITRLEKDIFPWIGARPIADIAAPELLAALQDVLASHDNGFIPSEVKWNAARAAIAKAEGF